MITGALILTAAALLCYFGCRKFRRDIHAMFEHSECPDREA